ncbi:hypothetical protein EYF80_007102 [Liparis tanakae]|uniref:Uncharacterized protein n=1 Tax=Liparis tanakae TaxID=230148 RepID=A0A4Z2IYH8_9TELE|nr:hypothetical protein EYF80_007102 [Liparis tanakae]
MKGYPNQRLAEGMLVPPYDAGSFKKCFITGAPTPTKLKLTTVGHAPTRPSVISLKELNVSWWAGVDSKRAD